MTQLNGHVQVKKQRLDSALCDSKSPATASMLRFFLLVCLFVFVFFILLLNFVIILWGGGYKGKQQNQWNGKRSGTRMNDVEYKKYQLK